MKQTNREVLLHLSLIEGVGPQAMSKLVKAFKDLSELSDMPASDIVQRAGVSQSLAADIVAGLGDAEALKRELDLVKRYKIVLLTILDDDYPTDLLSIHSPPPVLYCLGAPLHKEAKRIAFVGSRKAGKYAQQSVDALVPEMLSEEYEIISGGALGVDTMAHKCALEHSGRTIVVLGSGLLQPYPQENRELFRAVVRQGGTVVSPFPLNLPPSKSTFPARNRIIAGLSAATVVVQAAQKSGALITAQCAADEGRGVFAVPGSVFDELSAGCHFLIGEGATLVNGPADILESLGHEYVQPEVEEEEEAAAAPVAEKPVHKITDPVLAVLDRAMTIDEICSTLDMQLVVVQTKLFTLQIEGKVKQNFAGAWEREDTRRELWKR